MCPDDFSSNKDYTLPNHVCYEWLEYSGDIKSTYGARRASYVCGPLLARVGVGPILARVAVARVRYYSITGSAKTTVPDMRFTLALTISCLVAPVI